MIDVKRHFFRAGRSDTTEHSISQVVFTLTILLALAPVSPTVACVWLIGVALTRGGGA